MGQPGQDDDLLHRTGLRHGCPVRFRLGSAGLGTGLGVGLGGFVSGLGSGDEATCEKCLPRVGECRQEVGQWGGTGSEPLGNVLVSVLGSVNGKVTPRCPAK